jgi:hypothetical protein
MPIIVSYDTIGALGGAAMQSGYQQGVAGGQQDYYNRQGADSRMLLQNAFQRHDTDRRWQLGEISADRHRDFQADQSGINRGFAAEQADLNRQTDIEGLYLRENIRRSGDERDFEQGQEMARLQDELIGKRQITALNDTQAFQDSQNQIKLKKDEEAFMSAAQASGMGPDEARKAWSSSVVQEQLRQGPWAPGAGRAGRTETGQDKMFGELGTLSGEWLQRGAIAAQMGDYSRVLDAAAQVQKMGQSVREGKTPVNDALQGIYVQTTRQPTEQLIANMQVAPPEVRRIIQSELDRRGAMQYGSNQATPGGGSSLQGMSNEELLQLRQRLSNPGR